jgi:glucokinase
MEYGFGIDLGGTAVKLGYYHTSGKLLDKWEIPTDTSENGANILKDIAASVENYMAQNRIPRDKIIGIGIGVPGPVDKKGNVNRCINLGWGVFNIENELSALTGFPVKAANDANVAALGECWQGAAKGFENVVMLTLGTGVGGAVILDGQILHGSHGAAGEVGHMVMDPTEKEPCGCGKYGCAEQYCSATGIVRVAKRYLKMSFDPSVLREIDPLTCKDVFDAAAAGDAGAKDILDQVYGYLAKLCADICAVVNPEVIVIGGGVSKAGNVLIDGVNAHFEKFAFHAVRNVRFVLATLGNDAGTCGAFRLIQLTVDN